MQICSPRRQRRNIPQLTYSETTTLPLGLASASASRLVSGTTRPLGSATASGVRFPSVRYALVSTQKRPHR